MSSRKVNFTVKLSTTVVNYDRNAFSTEGPTTSHSYLLTIVSYMNQSLLDSRVLTSHKLSHGTIVSKPMITGVKSWSFPHGPKSRTPAIGSRHSTAWLRARHLLFRILMHTERGNQTSSPSWSGDVASNTTIWVSTPARNPW